MPLIHNNDDAIPIHKNELDEFFYKLPVEHPSSNLRGLIKCRLQWIRSIDLDYDLRLPTTKISISASCDDELFLMEKEPKMEEEDFVRVRDMPNGQANDESFFDFLRSGGQINYAENLDSAEYFKDHHFTPPLGELLSKAKQMHSDIGGVTTKYYYVGCQNSLFALHSEDSDLAAINVNLGGADKIWFSMGPESYKKARQLIEQDLKDSPCAYPLRHKYQFPLPEFFTRHGLNVYRTVQRPGEAIYNIPGGLHWGYSTGINVGVAWNYGGLSFAAYGLDSQNCDCLPTYPKINVWEVSRHFVKDGKKPWLKEMEKGWTEDWNTPFFFSYFPNTFPIFSSYRLTLKNLPHYEIKTTNLNLPSTSKFSKLPPKYYCHNNIYFKSAEFKYNVFRYQCCTSGCTMRLNRNPDTWQITTTGHHNLEKDHKFVPNSDELSMKFPLK